jgi:hypothetical protein
MFAVAARPVTGVTGHLLGAAQRAGIRQVGHAGPGAFCAQR